MLMIQTFLGLSPSFRSFVQPVRKLRIWEHSNNMLVWMNVSVSIMVMEDLQLMNPSGTVL